MFWHSSYCDFPHSFLGMDRKRVIEAVEADRLLTHLVRGRVVRLVDDVIGTRKGHFKVTGNSLQGGVEDENADQHWKQSGGYKERFLTLISVGKVLMKTCLVLFVHRFVGFDENSLRRHCAHALSPFEPSPAAILLPPASKKLFTKLQVCDDRLEMYM